MDDTFLQGTAITETTYNEGALNCFESGFQAEQMKEAFRIWK